MRVLHAGNDPGFAQELLFQIRCNAKCGIKNLYCDVALELGIVGAEDSGKSAGSKNIAEVQRVA